MKIPFGERYRVLEELERTAFFATFLCFDDAYGTEVEVDDIEVAEAPPDLIERLRQLLDACLKISTRYAPPLLEWCEEEGHIYLIRERSDGESLADILDETGQLPGRQMAEITRAITETLAEAYGRGVFYLGLNPGQLRVDARGRAKVVRAGYSWILEELGPALSARVSHYRAPETDGSVEGARISDIYSLALMIKGALPRDLSSERLRSLLERCLDPMPSHRPSSPRLLLEELEASVGAEEARSAPRGGSGEDDRGGSIADDFKKPPAQSYLSLAKPPRRRYVRTLLLMLLGGLAVWLVFAAASGFCVACKKALESVVTEGKPEVNLPDLEGLPAQEAQDIVERLGLVAELREAPSRLWSAGVVAAQEPAAGSVLEDGDHVYLSISSGNDEAQASQGSEPAPATSREDAGAATPVGSSSNPEAPVSQTGDSPQEQKQPVPPKAVAAASGMRGPAPFYVVLDASSSYDPDGSIVRYVWDCGDGTVLEGARAQHVFDPPVIPARFHVSLRVFDNQGLSASSSLSLEVY